MLINLTPHAIVFLASDNTVVRTIPASGAVARCATTATTLPDVDGVPAVKAGYGEVEVVGGEYPIPLPDPQEGVVLVVSGLVRAALPGRGDLASPGDQVRDPQNPSRIIGCRRLDF